MFSLSYKTYSDLIKDIKENIARLPEDIDLIVGIPRSGMIPAYMIGLALSKPVCSLDEFISGIYKEKVKTTYRFEINKKIKNILIMDDSVNTGNAIEKTKRFITDAKLDKQFNITYAAVYYSAGADKFVDIALSFCPQPRMFQWNYLNHGFLKNAAFDIDGVLCVDPTDTQNDDGNKYKKFILNAKPLYIPNYKIGALVTSRLGKYRKETEAWMKDNGVQYNKLYMLENKTAKERRDEGLHAKHKAKIYKTLKDCNLFIESEPSQAAEIARLSGKLCFCSKTDELFGMEKSNNFKLKSKPKLLCKIIALFIPFKKLRKKVRGN